MDDERGRRAVEVVERYVDALATDEELRVAADAAVQAWRDAEAAYAASSGEVPVLYVPVPSVNVLLAAAYAAGRVPDCVFKGSWYGLAAWAADKCRAAILFAAAELRKDERPQTDAEVSAHLALVRDCLGNPFTPVIFDAAWRSADVLSLAKSIYEERCFERMAVLGDALAKAGCSNLDIISHCHSEKIHVRGCWVLDLVLAKT